MSFNLQGSGSAGGGSIVVSDSHIFVDTTARDSYFISNPSELVNNVYVYITGTSSLQQYRTTISSWVDVTPVIRGPKGDFPTIHDLTEKVTLVNDDVFLIEDSENSYSQKKVKKSNLITNTTWGSIAGTLTDQDDLTNALASKVNTTTTVNGQALSSNVVITIPDELSDFAADSTHRVVTDAQITTWNNKQDFASRGVANGYCPLGSDSKVPSSYIGQITVTSVFPTTIEPSTPSEGMVWINTDTSISKIYDADTLTWYELGNSAGYVTTVNGYSGPTVTLNKSDIGLGSVVNVDTTNASNITSGTLSPSIFPTATPSTLGGIKVGSGLSITGDGTLSSDTTSGEANTASNLGTGSDGEGLYSTKSGVELKFRRIKAGTNVTLTSEVNDVVINASTSGEANTASNVGTGTGTIFKQKTGVDLELKTIKAGTNVTITNNASDITINSSASGTIGGTTGSTDNAIIRADGTGGTTLQSSLVTVDDTGSINIPTGEFYKINGTALTYSDVDASPTTHVHGNVTNDGKIGSTSGIPIITGTSGILQAGEFGTTDGTFCQGNDSRLSDVRDPNISGLTTETSIADDDYIAIYDTSVSANRKMTKANFVAGLSGSSTVKVSSNDSTAGYLNGKLVAGSGISFEEGSDGGNETLTISASGVIDHWISIPSGYTATPASTSTLTMTSDLTGTLKPGYGLRYTIGGTVYHGAITTITSNLMTIAGASLSGDVSALYYTKIGVVQLPILIPGYYEDATEACNMCGDLGQTLVWQQGPAKMVRALMYSRVVDASSNGYVNIRQGSAVTTGTATAGAATTITLAAGSSDTDDYYNNMWIRITAGTGVGQSRKITDYVGSTKVATVATWTTNPSTDSVYEIVSPIINSNTYSGLLVDTTAAKSTVIDIDTSKYAISYGDIISVMSLKGTSGDAQDLSVMLTYVMV